VIGDARTLVNTTGYQGRKKEESIKPPAIALRNRASLLSPACLWKLLQPQSASLSAPRSDSRVVTGSSWACPSPRPSRSSSASLARTT
jgi:hypothetical protein